MIEGLNDIPSAPTERATFVVFPVGLTVEEEELEEEKEEEAGGRRGRSTQA